MLREIYNNLPSEQRARIKHAYYTVQKIVSDNLFAYDKKELKTALQRLGIGQGDTLFVHSSFRRFNGFQGSPQDIINALIEVLGEKGNLLMPALQYRSSSYEQMRKNELFDVMKTYSRMGLVTEIFRRNKGVLRSLHPTHSVLATGKDAQWLVEGHEKCFYPCGKHTPFEKFRSLGGKVLFFDVSFNTFTFIHYIEDLIKSELPFALYREEPMSATLRNAEGTDIAASTYVFSNDAVTRRRPEILKKQLLCRGLLRRERIGRTALMLVIAEDAVRCAREMIVNNVYFYAGAGAHA